MKVIVLGGDGFCGWPTALHLAAQDHEILIIDDGRRRSIDAVELYTESVTPIETLPRRVRDWNRGAFGAPIDCTFTPIDVEYARLVRHIKQFEPDAIVHFAEQRSAPYSMRDARRRRETVQGNIAATNNVLCAVAAVRPQCHVVHLGTMGVYGYGGGGVIPEGYFDFYPVENDQFNPAQINNMSRELHPMRPGSIYHATKCMDQILFQFYARNDGLKITDLHQGIVWGCDTDETALDPALVNRLDYCGDFGTVLNRFTIEAVFGHPLTVHGSGGQTRAFINIRDTVNCVRAAIEAPDEGRRDDEPVRIFNQAAEAVTIHDLAMKVKTAVDGYFDNDGSDDEALIQHVDNPRNEAAANNLDFDNEGLRALGWSPMLIEDGLVDDVLTHVVNNKDRIDPSKIPATAQWRFPSAADTDADAPLDG